MSTLWNRLKYTVQADLHELFDKKESKNPISLLNQYLREAEKQTEAVGKLLKRQQALKEELEKELQEAENMAAKRRNQLALARETGDDELIAFAEAEVQAYEGRAAQISASIKETTYEQMSLEQKFEEMKHKVKDMKVRQLQLMGKENVTRARRQMDKVITPGQMEGPLATMDEMHRYIENLGEQIDRSHQHSSMEQRLEILEKTAAKKEEVV